LPFEQSKKPEEIAKLIEAGFEYLCEQDGLKFFIA
jgi:hypothetical protein